MTRTNNLSNTQFGYQLVLFIHIYGWLKVAFGIFYLGKLAVGSFDWRHVYFYSAANFPVTEGRNGKQTPSKRLTDIEVISTMNR